MQASVFLVCIYKTFKYSSKKHGCFLYIILDIEYYSRNKKAWDGFGQILVDDRGEHRLLKYVVILYKTDDKPHTENSSLPYE